MRNCPVCESKKRESKWIQTFLVPEGWTQPRYLDWFVCKCGMIYADNLNISQLDYDVYYKERYGFGVEDKEAIARQWKRASELNDTIQKTGNKKDILIVDFGGVGILTGKLKEFDFTNCRDVSAGEELPDNIDILFAEHVLEHVYDLPKAMRQISKSMKMKGTLVVDGPESAGIASHGSTPMLDWHQKHINHFAFVDYLNLMRLHGFEFVGAGNYIERNNPCMHFVFGRAEKDRIAISSIEHITKNMDAMVEKLKALGDQPLIVWGCGDIALHVLSRHFPKGIKYFVDKDPAFIEAEIKNRWVRQTVMEGDTAPIVVIAQGQRQAILDNIKADKLTNEAIVI